MIPFYNNMLLCVKVLFPYVVGVAPWTGGRQLLVFSGDMDSCPGAVMFFILKTVVLPGEGWFRNMLCRKSLDTQHIV